VNPGPNCPGGVNQDTRSQAGIFTFDENNYIVSTGPGWRWYDRLGNSIDYDEAGHMLGWSDAAGNQTTLARDAQGRIAGVFDSQGQQIISISYSGDNGYPSRVSDTQGHTVAYEWSLPDGASQPSTSIATCPEANVVTSPNGSIGLALLTKVTGARGGVWNYTYTATGYIQTRTDPTGGQISLSYATQPERALIDPRNPRNTTKAADTVGSGGTGSMLTTSSCGSTIGATTLALPQAIRVASIKDEVGAVTGYGVSYDSTKREYHVKPNPIRVWAAPHAVRAPAHGLTCSAWP